MRDAVGVGVGVGVAVAVAVAVEVEVEVEVDVAGGGGGAESCACARAAVEPAIRTAARRMRMALTPTLYDFDVALSHVDRDLHERLSFKVARHPSETLDRMWLRALAYCWLHEERMTFGPGISDPDEPDLFAEDLTGQKTLWVRVGKPDPVKLQREADRAGRARVAVLFESPQRLEAFVAEAREAKLARLARIELAAVDATLLARLAAVEERRTRLALTIVGDHLYVERGGQALDGALTRATLG